MISLTDVYHVIAATVPLYVAMILAYISMKWWKLFTADQCSGINKFVAKFSIPLLTFQVIAANDPYKMNLRLMFADFLQKALAIFILGIITRVFSRGRGLDWIITGISLSTLPNTLILGIPLLKAMYGEDAKNLLAQIVVLQSIVWYNILLFLFELNLVKTAAIQIPPLDNNTVEVEVETPQEAQSKELVKKADTRRPKEIKTMDILLIVLRKLVMNPNTHATALGVVWACIHFRWKVDMPVVINNSILILSDGGLGMAMFSMGLFMASQKSLIACGTRKAMLAMGMKFFMGPALMAAASFSIQLRGTVFKVAIVQAALPQGIVPFVFAKEYGLHPDILSTGVIFGMLISLPIALAYYFLLAL